MALKLKWSFPWCNYINTTGFFCNVARNPFFLCVSEYKISNHNVLDEVKVLLFKLERAKYCFIWASDWKKKCKHQVKGVHNINIFRREQNAAVSCRLPMNYGCGSRPLATFCYNVNFSHFWFSVICIYKESCQASKPRNVLKIFTWSLKVWTAVE